MCVYCHATIWLIYSKDVVKQRQKIWVYFSKYYIQITIWLQHVVGWCNTILTAALSLVERNYVLLYSNNQLEDFWLQRVQKLIAITPFRNLQRGSLTLNVRGTLLSKHDTINGNSFCLITRTPYMSKGHASNNGNNTI